MDLVGDYPLWEVRMERYYRARGELQKRWHERGFQEHAPNRKAAEKAAEMKHPEWRRIGHARRVKDQGEEQEDG